MTQFFSVILKTFWSMTERDRPQHSLFLTLSVLGILPGTMCYFHDFSIFLPVA